MRRLIIIFVAFQVSAFVFAQGRSEQSVRNEYEGYIRAKEQYLSRCISEINSSINLRNGGFISEERYQELRTTWEDERRKTESEIERLRNKMESELNRARQEEQQRIQAAQQKAQRERAEQAKIAQRAQLAQRAQREREIHAQRARELEAKREAERIERERRWKEEEEARKRKIDRDYNNALRSSNGYYANMKRKAEWMASPEALHAMQDNLSQTRLEVSIDDVDVKLPEKQVTSSGGINRLKQRMNRSTSSDVVSGDNLFDEASIFTLSSIGGNKVIGDHAGEWPYASQIPITQRQRDPLYSYEEPPVQIKGDMPGRKDEFVKSLANMESGELHYLEQVYGDYCELAEMADYSYHGQPLSSNLIKSGWCDMSSENTTVKKICDDAEMENETEASGLKLSVLKKGDRYVVAFGGTDFPKDVLDLQSDKELIKDGKSGVTGFFSSEEQQILKAKEAVRRLVEDGDIPLNKIEFTGHSLGGRLASEMSVAYARPAITFNAAGVSEQTRNEYESLMKNTKGGYQGIVNITTEHDILTRGQTLASGAANPYVKAIPKEEIKILHETVSGTLSSNEGKVVKKVLDNTGPLGKATGSVIDGIDKTLSYADKINTYYNRDYRALGASIVIPDQQSGIDAHKLSEIKAGLYSRHGSLKSVISASDHQ